MKVDLSHNVALITGASSGLGRHFALTLAKAGAKVAIAARRAPLLESLAQEIAAFDGRALPLLMDVTDRAAVARGFAETETELGPVTLVINNAGLAAAAPALSTTAEEWDSVIATDLTGLWNVAQVAAQQMVKHAIGGSIINIASIMGLAGASQLAAYCAAKAGVINLTKALAVEWARHGIRVNALAPGYIETDMNRDTLAGPAGEVMRRKIPQRRFGQPSDLEGALLLLASDASAFMTGSVLVVDGGQAAQM